MFRISIRNSRRTWLRGDFMGFWVFMLFMVLLIPLIMVLFGRYFIKRAPENINYLFGYRTNLSMKNEDTWKFAHKYIGNIWYKWGLIMLPISVLLMVFVIGKSEDTIGMLGAVISVVQILPILVTIVLTEKALKKNFDEEGNRKNGKLEE